MDNVQSTQPMPPSAGPGGKAIATLILGILSLVGCGFLCGVPAVILGKMELNAISAGRSERSGHSITQIGFVLGIVGTVLCCLVALAYATIFAFGISLGFLEEFKGST